MKKFVMAICLFAAVGCKGVNKNEAAAQPVTASATAQPQVTDAQIQSEYSLGQISSAANLLRVAFDASLENKPEPGTAIIGCPITAEQAQQWVNPARAVLDTKMESERKEYLRDPAAYRKSHALDKCQSECTCGTYADLLDPAVRTDFKTPKAFKEHRRLLQRVRKQSEGLKPAAALQCAKKQTWFCGSNLKTYLQAESVAQGT